MEPDLIEVDYLTYVKGWASMGCYPIEKPYSIEGYDVVDTYDKNGNHCLSWRYQLPNPDAASPLYVGSKWYITPYTQKRLRLRENTRSRSQVKRNILY